MFYKCTIESDERPIQLKMSFGGSVNEHGIRIKSIIKVFSV